jgi:O-antigen/teichoic acid export membrane protein
MGFLSRQPASRASKVIGTVAVRATNLVLGATASVVIARALGPEGRGSYYVIITVATVAVTLGQSSLDHAHLYAWSKGGDRRVLFANALVLSLVLGLIVAPLAFGVVAILGPTVVPVASHCLLVVALVAVPLSILRGYYIHFLILADRIRWMNAMVLSVAVAQCGALILTAALGRLTVGTVVYVWLLANIPGVLIALSAIRPRLRDFSAGQAIRTWQLGLRFHAGTVAMYLLLRADVFLLNSSVSRREVGLYSLAVTLAELVYLITDSVGHVAVSRQATGTLGESGQATAHAARVNFVAAVVCVIGVAAVAPVLVPLMYGADFRGSVGPLLLIGPGIVALAVARPISVFLTRLNRPLALSALSGGALVLNVALNLLLIPTFGIRGAAAASTVSYGALSAFFAGWLLRASDVRPRDLMPRVADISGPLRSLLRR